MEQHRVIKSDLYGNLARIGKALSSPKRLEIIDLLSQAERPVDAIAKATLIGIGNASAHLKVLYAARLVHRRKEGQQVFYRLASLNVFRLFRDLEHVGEEQLAEVERLVRLYYESPDELEPVSSAELLRRVTGGEVLLLDVRPPEEYRAGHVPGAVNVPPGELESRLDALPRDRDIMAYCRGRYCLFSVEAVTLLRQHGFRARRMAEGLPDWQARGQPVAVGAD